MQYSSENRSSEYSFYAIRITMRRYYLSRTTLIALRRANSSADFLTYPADLRKGTPRFIQLRLTVRWVFHVSTLPRLPRLPGRCQTVYLLVSSVLRRRQQLSLFVALPGGLLENRSRGSYMYVQCNATPVVIRINDCAQADFAKHNGVRVLFVGHFNIACPFERKTSGRKLRRLYAFIRPLLWKKQYYSYYTHIIYIYYYYYSEREAITHTITAMNIFEN